MYIFSTSVFTESWRINPSIVSVHVQNSVKFIIFLVPIKVSRKQVRIMKIVIIFLLPFVK